MQVYAVFIRDQHHKTIADFFFSIQVPKPRSVMIVTLDAYNAIGNENCLISANTFISFHKKVIFEMYWSLNKKAMI